MPHYPSCLGSIVVVVELLARLSILKICLLVSFMASVVNSHTNNDGNSHNPSLLSIYTQNTENHLHARYCGRDPNSEY